MLDNHWNFALTRRALCMFCAAALVFGCSARNALEPTDNQRNVGIVSYTGLDATTPDGTCRVLGSANAAALPPDELFRILVGDDTVVATLVEGNVQLWYCGQRIGGSVADYDSSGDGSNGLSVAFRKAGVAMLANASAAAIPELLYATPSVSRSTEMRSFALRLASKDESHAVIVARGTSAYEVLIQYNDGGRRKLASFYDLP